MAKERKVFSRLPKTLAGKSIKKQMYYVYFIAMVLPILLVGLFLIAITSKQLTLYHIDLINSDNLRVKNIMFQITTQVHNLSENISFDDDLQSLISGRYNSTENFRHYANRVSIIDNYLSTYMEVQSIEIYSDNPYFRDYKQYYRAEEDIEKSDWFVRAKNQADVFWITLPREDNYGNVYWNLCLVRRIPVVNSPYHAVLLMRISEDYLRSGIVGDDFISYISVNDSNVFFSQNRSAQGKEPPLNIDYSSGSFKFSGRTKYKDHRAFACVSSFGAYQSDSKIYITTLNTEGYNEIAFVILVCVLIIAGAVVFPGILIYFFTNYFTGRIEVLRQDMHKASRHDYEIDEVFAGNDEISEAYRDLQIMVKNIKEQEATVYQTRIKEQELESQQREMEYKHLASQINPHFLYNTLETIRMKAFTAGDKEVAYAIKLLGKSMRYVLSNTGNTETSLMSELEHIRVYIEIQKMRFGDRFDCKINIADDIEPERIKILPLMIQPIVENAVVHGMEQLAEGGQIEINVYEGEDDRLVIDVIDNGGGMDEIQLAALMDNIRTKDVSRYNSIGLYNINQRLLMLYGEEYALNVFSSPGQGTCIRLTLPEEKVYH